MDSTPSLEKLNDQTLLRRFGDLVCTDCHHTATLLRHIDVIDRRQLWAKQGHSSLFDFLVSRHHMSESTAGKRIGAARAARRFPVLFDMVARGEIHLSGIHLLKAHLTPENCAQVLAQAKHKSMREIERLVAQLAPQPDVPSRLRALPNRQAAPAAPTLSAPVPRVDPTLPEPAPALAPRRSPDPMPLAPGRYKLQVTLSEGTCRKLKQLQDLLAHQLPNGDPAAIIERALDALLIEVHKRKSGLTAKPRLEKAQVEKAQVEKAQVEKAQVEKAKVETAPVGKAARVKSQATKLAVPAGRSRAIPAALRHEVWTRDQGRCAFISDDGHRCGETRRLEFAHLNPWAKGGEHTTTNIALRCAAHNAFEANRDYGTSFMAGKRKRKVPDKP